MLLSRGVAPPRLLPPQNIAQAAQQHGDLVRQFNTKVEQQKTQLQARQRQQQQQVAAHHSKAAQQLQNKVGQVDPQQLQQEQLQLQRTHQAQRQQVQNAHLAQQQQLKQQIGQLYATLQQRGAAIQQHQQAYATQGHPGNTPASAAAQQQQQSIQDRLQALKDRTARVSPAGYTVAGTSQADTMAQPTTSAHGPYAGSFPNTSLATSSASSVGSAGPQLSLQQQQQQQQQQQLLLQQQMQMPDQKQRALQGGQPGGVMYNAAQKEQLQKLAAQQQVMANGMAGNQAQAHQAHGRTEADQNQLLLQQQQLFQAQQLRQREDKMRQIQAQIEGKLKVQCRTIQEEILTLEGYLRKLTDPKQSQGRQLVQIMLEQKRKQVQGPGPGLNQPQVPIQPATTASSASTPSFGGPNGQFGMGSGGAVGMPGSTPGGAPVAGPARAGGGEAAVPRAARRMSQQVAAATPTPTPVAHQPVSENLKFPENVPRVPAVPLELRLAKVNRIKLTKPQQHLLRDLIAAYGQVTKNDPVQDKQFDAFSRKLKNISDTIQRNEDKRVFGSKAASWSAPTIERIKTFSLPMHPGLPAFDDERQSPLTDDAYLRRSRDEILATRIELRKKVLKRIRSKPPANAAMAAATTSIVVESRALELLGFQRKIRADVIAFEAQAKDGRVAFKQMQKDNLVLEKQIHKMYAKVHKGELVPPRGVKSKHKKKWKALFDHQAEFSAFHKLVRKRCAGLANAVVRHFESIKLEEERLQDRNEKERMTMLRMNDEEGYRKLIDNQKDGRLKHLLDKTDEYMKSMDDLIRGHQQVEETSAKRRSSMISRADSAAIGIDGDGPDTEMAVVDDEDASIVVEAATEKERSHQTKYGLAHRIQETVTEQPDMLKFGTLKDYQVDGLEWLLSLYNNRLNGILADEMGLGKTIQSLALLTYLIEKKGVPGPYLVIVPNSVLSNWVNEFERWAPTVTYIPYRGNKPKRKSMHDQIKSGEFNILLTTYEFVMSDKAVLGKISWAYMIIDEGHRLKNKDGKLTKVLANNYDAPRRLLLSGTPLQNSLPELWALLNFLLPEIFKSADNFDEWFAKPFAATGEKVDLTEEERMLVIQRLHKVLRPFLLRRLKKDVMKELPQKVVHVLKCEMSAMQRKLYHHLKTHGVILSPPDLDDPTNAAAQGPGNVKYLNNTIMQLRKVCNHPFLFQAVDQGMVRHLGLDAKVVNTDDLWRSCGKFELLDRVLNKMFYTGHRVLLFSQMVELLVVLEDYCVLRGIEYLKLDGNTKGEDRGELITKFNGSTRYKLFILSTRAGGLGLNLQGADTVIIYDSDWNPHQDLQAQDRAHRIGQTQEVRVFRFVTVNSVEESIFETAQEKLQMDAQVIQAGQFNKSSTASDRQEFLRKLLEAGEEEEVGEDTEALLPDAEQMNLYLARSDEELVIFARLDEELRVRDQNTWMNEIRKTRLMGVSELPDWMIRSDGDVNWQATEKDRVDMNLGRGTRVTRDIDYNHEIRFSSDEESGNGEFNSRGRRKRKRLGIPDPDAVADADADAYASSPGGGRRRIRNKDPAPARPGHGNVTWESSIKEQSLWLLRMLANHRVGNRKLADNYIMLPDKQALAVYYTIVTRPIAIKQMRRKADRYKSLGQLADDVRLMVENSMAFNASGSQIIEDAVLLEELFIEERKRFDPPEGALAGASAADGDGCRGGSEAATPAAAPAPAPAPAPEAQEAHEGGEGVLAPGSLQTDPTADPNLGPARSAEPAPVAEEAAAAAEGAGTGESSSSSSDSSSSSGSESEGEHERTAGGEGGSIKLTFQVSKKQRRN